MEDGTLTRILPGWSIVGGQLTLVWPESRHPSPRVRAFIDVATDSFKESAQLDVGPTRPRRRRAYAP